MKNDVQRQMYLPYINHFLAERFSSLSLGAFESNAERAAKCHSPSWASKSFFGSPNGRVFASNLVVTRDEFVNAEHKDNDHSGYAFGLFSLIKRDTGKLYHRGRTSKHGYVKGARFVFSDYNVEVNFDKCDGVVEMVWATDINHYSTSSKTYNEDDERVQPEKADITRFGCSCQISKSIVDRINQITNMRGEMSDAEWETYREGLVENYADELHRKREMLHAQRKKDQMDQLRLKLKMCKWRAT